MTIEELSARLEVLERQNQELADKQAIRDCVTAYARGLDRLDKDLIRDAFHPDALDDHGVFVGGPAELAEWAVELHREEARSSLHYTGTHSCEIDGDTAHAETYWLGTLRDKSGAFNLAGGRWLDRLEKRGGEWRIAVRVCIPEFAGKPPMGDAPDVSDELRAASALPQRDRTDPSYVRPLAIDPARVGLGA